MNQGLRARACSEQELRLIEEGEWWQGLMWTADRILSVQLREALDTAPSVILVAVS